MLLMRVCKIYSKQAPCTIRAFDHRPLFGDERAYHTEKNIKKNKIVGRNTKLRVIVDSYLYVAGRTSSYVAVLR